MSDDARLGDDLSHLAPERRQQCVFLAKKWQIPRGEALILLESAADTRPPAEGEYAN